MRESVWPFPIVGACFESVTGARRVASGKLFTSEADESLDAGGNHFRAYRQNGTEANSGAWFLAASKELVRPLTQCATLSFGSLLADERDLRCGR